MSKKDEISRFKEIHPYPGADEIDSLYRFSKINNDTIEFHKKLFVDKKLYHALPSDFNDPFECKPHFNWPTDPKKVQRIRKHLITIHRNNGSTQRQAEAIVSENMKKPEFVEEKIYGAIQSSLSKVRICCFTKRKDNLLLWAHYADCHKGLCVEYDTTIPPMKIAYKVAYSNEYPEAEYPGPQDEILFAPILTKSKAWSYEEEYRTIYAPGNHQYRDADEESLSLPENAIKNVYFGAKIKSSDKEKVLGLISEGPFNPGIWQAKLSKSEFNLEFVNENSESS